MTKNLIILFIALSNFAFAQNFPGKNVNLLRNKIVKPKEYKEEQNKSFHYRNFYKNFDTISKKLETYNNNIFQDKNYNSNYYKLVGLPFKVTNIYKKKMLIESPSFPQEYVLELFNDSIGVIYYDYDTEYEFNYELEVVGGLNVPNDFYCKEIEYEKDKFTNEEKYSTPIQDGITLIKYIENGKTSIYMMVYVIGYTANVGEQGAYLLLENGSKITKLKEPIDIDVNENNYRYSAFILLNTADIALLKKYKITDIRLYIYDRKFEEEAAIRIKGYLNCLIK